MSDIKKYVEGKSQAELIEIQRNSVVDGDIYKAVTFEIQRIQQDTNNTQIANLIGEIKKLKNIAESNASDSKRDASSSKRLSRIAIWIAVIAIIVQVIFSIRNKSDCIWSSVSTGDPRTHYSGCYRQFDFGLLGTYTFSLPDHY